MGASAPASPAERGRPVFFLKPADAIVIDGVVPYPPGTNELHHEVELVVALGRDAARANWLAVRAQSLVFGYAVGLDLTRRDLQAEAKAKGLPWDIGKAFDASAPISEIVPAAEINDLASRTLTLRVNDERRQHGALSDLIWNVHRHPARTVEALRAARRRPGLHGHARGRRRRCRSATASWPAWTASSNCTAASRRPLASHWLDPRALRNTEETGDGHVRASSRNSSRAATSSIWRSAS